MKPILQRERGTAAIEMAAVLILGTILLIGVVLLGRLTWHAIAMQKAVSNVGRIVSALPVETLTTFGVAVPLQAIAVSHVQTATRSAGLDIQPPGYMIAVQCSGIPCGSTALDTVGVVAVIRFHDTIFGNEVSKILELDGVDINPVYLQTYVR